MSSNNPTTSQQHQPDDNLATLLALHDQNFILAAYQTLLGRAPDATGLEYYLKRLRSGIAKIQILAQLRLCTESKQHIASLPDLDIAIKHYQLGRLPIVGWLFRQFYGLEGDTITERRLRLMENQLFFINDANIIRFNQIETTLAAQDDANKRHFIQTKTTLTGLHNLVASQTQTNNTSLNKNETNIETLQPINIPKSDGLNQLLPRAKNIYIQLKLAVVMYAARGA